MFSWGNSKIICWFAKQLLNFCLFNFSGKILNDETALKEYKIDEKNFVVVMVTKVSNCFFWIGGFISLILFFLVMSDCICSSLKTVEFYHMQVQVNIKKLVWTDKKYCFTVLVLPRLIFAAALCWMFVSKKKITNDWFYCLFFLVSLLFSPFYY